MVTIQAISGNDRSFGSIGLVANEVKTKIGNGIVNKLNGF
jgi:hypothetical protein